MYYPDNSMLCDTSILLLTSCKISIANNQAYLLFHQIVHLPNRTPVKKYLKLSLFYAHSKLLSHYFQCLMRLARILCEEDVC